jgi:hypothetical protein
MRTRKHTEARSAHALGFRGSLVGSLQLASIVSPKPSGTGATGPGTPSSAARDNIDDPFGLGTSSRRGSALAVPPISGSASATSASQQVRQAASKGTSSAAERTDSEGSIESPPVWHMRFGMAGFRHALLLVAREYLASAYNVTGPAAQGSTATPSKAAGAGRSPSPQQTEAKPTANAAFRYTRDLSRVGHRLTGVSH